MCGCTMLLPFWSKLTLKFVCVPFTTEFGEGCRITLRLPPLVGLFIAITEVTAYVDEVVSKIPKMLAIKGKVITVLLI
jgi:hypothetical protein